MAGSRWASLGISVVVNGAILAAMARVLAGPPVPAETLVCVELESPAPVRISRLPSPQPTTAAAAPPRVRPPVEKARPVPVSEAPKRPILRVLRLPRMFSPTEPKADVRPADSSQTRPVPSPEDSGPRQRRSAGGGTVDTRGTSGPHGDSGSSGGGTTGRGPGASSSSGTGNGGTTRGGSGGDDRSVIAVADNKQEARRIEPVPPKPDPPAAKGETRGAQADRQPRPPYPSDARDDGVEGTVVLLATVSPEGKVTETRIEKGSGDRRLDRAAEQGVRQWAYRPALRDGTPVKATIRVRVEFRLE